MPRVVQKLKVLSIGASISESILQQLEKLMQTLESHNVKIAGNEVTQPFHAEFKVQSVSSTMDHTNRKIIVNMAGVARLTRK